MWCLGVECCCETANCAAAAGAAAASGVVCRYGGSLLLEQWKWLRPPAAHARMGGGGCGLRLLLLLRGRGYCALAALPVLFSTTNAFL